MRSKAADLVEGDDVCCCRADQGTKDPQVARQDQTCGNYVAIGDLHQTSPSLAGEFFEREGYRVEMGPGRGDGGVDLRVFPKDAGEGDPPLIIVQCKRQKAKIDMVLVKSVYTDVEWEKAKSGLIVTTSTFAPGADRVRTARAYAVEAADRPKLREWLTKMRSGA